jgi:hypothetical protein
VGHLGCFHNLVIVISASLYIGVQVPQEYLCDIPVGISLGVGLLDHMVELCLDS